MFCCFKVQPLTAMSAAIFLLLLGSSLPQQLYGFGARAIEAFVVVWMIGKHPSVFSVVVCTDLGWVCLADIMDVC